LNNTDRMAIFKCIFWKTAVNFISENNLFKLLTLLYIASRLCCFVVTVYRVYKKKGNRTSAPYCIWITLRMNIVTEKPLWGAVNKVLYCIVLYERNFFIFGKIRLSAVEWSVCSSCLIFPNMKKNCSCAE
jgi:hypothetical protein